MNLFANMSCFEALMIILFGVAWPMNILRTWRAANVEGKSLASNTLFFSGYMCGIVHKIFYSFDGVLVFYVINLLLVATDTLLVVYKRHLFAMGGRRFGKHI